MLFGLSSFCAVLSLRFECHSDMTKTCVFTYFLYFYCGCGSSRCFVVFHCFRPLMLLKNTSHFEPSRFFPSRPSHLLSCIILRRFPNSVCPSSFFHAPSYRSYSSTSLHRVFLDMLSFPSASPPITTSSFISLTPTSASPCRTPFPYHAVSSTHVCEYHICLVVSSTFLVLFSCLLLTLSFMYLRFSGSFVRHSSLNPERS